MSLHFQGFALFFSGEWYTAFASASNSLNTAVDYFSLVEALWNIIIICVKSVFLTMFLTDKDIIPKTLNDVKLINAGRILENNKTLAESRVPVGEVPGGVITMHVVVRPPQSDKSGIDLISLLFIQSPISLYV